MIDRNNPLIREATNLPPLDKLQLVDYLLESLDMPDKEIEKLWAEESSRRWEGYKAGEVGSVSAAAVLAGEITESVSGRRPNSRRCCFYRRKAFFTRI